MLQKTEAKENLALRKQFQATMVIFRSRGPVSTSSNRTSAASNVEVGVWTLIQEQRLHRRIIDLLRYATGKQKFKQNCKYKNSNNFV